jgi:hypothetical protein
MVLKNPMQVVWKVPKGGDGLSGCTRKAVKDEVIEGF